MNDLERTKQTVMRSCAALTAEAQALANSTPDWWVIAQPDMAYLPVVERDGGYALMGGPTALFPSSVRASMVANRLVEKDPSLKLKLDAMTVKFWAAKRVAALGAIVAQLSAKPEAPNV